MIGPLAADKKAAEFGYKRYGLPGAVVAGTGVVIGVKKILSIVAKKRDT